jgi:hypothetical protein
MAILRHAPGERAPSDGTYILVGHYGEPTDFAAWFDKGDRLPPVTVSAAIGPLWYVRVNVANERSRAA